MFLRKEDYLKQIQQTNLNQILEQSRSLSGDPEILAFTEKTAINFVKNHLSGRYRVDDIFADFKEFDITAEYKYGDRINLTAPTYAAATAYLVGDRVKYLNSVYECILNSTGNLPTNATYWILLGVEGIYSIDFPTRFDDRIYYLEDDLTNEYFNVYKKNENFAGYKEGTPVTIQAYWDLITPANYDTFTGDYPKDNTYWKLKDNRDFTLVKIIIDITLYDLHSIINPRNIPQLRQDRYTGSVEFLKDVVRGKMNMDLPSFKAQNGYRLRAGSEQQNINKY
jgi:hypothetical protein